MSAAKVGFTYGKCGRCGREYRVRRPAPSSVICDCYRYCPIEQWTKLMEPYTPDLTPSTYQAEESYAVKGQVVLAHEGGLDTFYRHDSPSDHADLYYSTQKPVEVRLT